jgi:fumarate hydratase class II
LDFATENLRAALPGLWELAIGGTAVGAGLNAPAGFGAFAAAGIARETGRPFVSAPNQFAAISAHGNRRTLVARKRTGIVDHAGQGQSDAV